MKPSTPVKSAVKTAPAMKQKAVSKSVAPVKTMPMNYGNTVNPKTGKRGDGFSPDSPAMQKFTAAQAAGRGRKY